MAEKQSNFEENLGWLRRSLLVEPRGHRNMIGAIITEPVRPESMIGVLFTKPDGYFSMCGDSAFSVACYLVESGLISASAGETSIEMDTVAGPVRADLVIGDGVCQSATIRNVPSYVAGTVSVQVDGASIECPVSYGGLTYGLVRASELGLSSLRFSELKEAQRRKVLKAGTSTLAAARAAAVADPSLPPVDLVTLWEPLENELGARVANFYAAETMGRTPSGTGLSARLAWEYESGRLSQGQDFVHESGLGMRFVGRVAEVCDPDAEQDGRRPIIPTITARSYLMGIQQMMFLDDDPFCRGFEL
jgi:proline racemase